MNTITIPFRGAAPATDASADSDCGLGPCNAFDSLDLPTLGLYNMDLSTNPATTALGSAWTRELGPGSSTTRTLSDPQLSLGTFSRNGCDKPCLIVSGTDSSAKHDQHVSLKLPGHFHQRPSESQIYFHASQPGHFGPALVTCGTQDGQQKIIVRQGVGSC